MSQRGFGIVSGTDSRDWREFGAWDDMLPRKDGVALELSLSPAHDAPPLDGHVPNYDELGVHRIINARGAYTVLGGSLMLPVAQEAMVQAAQSFVDLEELQEAVGSRLAKLFGCEFAIVTNGAAAAICQVVAACIAGTNPHLMERLPDTAGIPNEVIIQRSHLGEYDHAMRAAGARVVVVESLPEMRAAIGPNTVLLYALGVADHLPDSQVGVEEMGALAREVGLPFFVDAAAERPDVPNHYLAAGASAVVYSGGKAMQGPQSSGMLLGADRELLWTAALNGSPHHGVARALKASKEEIMGLLAAAEAWLARDHVAERARIDSQLDTIRRILLERAAAAAGGGLGYELSFETVPGLNGAPRAFITHRLRVGWPCSTSSGGGGGAGGGCGPAPTDVEAGLLRGSDGDGDGCSGPPIALIVWSSQEEEVGKEEGVLAVGGVDICAHFLQPGEEVLLAERLAAELLSHHHSRSHNHSGGVGGAKL